MPSDCKIYRRGEWIRVTPQDYIRQLKSDSSPLGIPHCVPSPNVLRIASNDSDCSIISGINNKKKENKSPNFLIANCFLVSCSPFGGPVAYYEKASRNITITDSMGRKLSQVNLSAEVVYLSWTVEQTNNVLIVLFKRGKVCFYDSGGQEVAGAVDIGGHPELYDGSGKGIAIVSSDTLYKHKLTVVTVDREAEGKYVASLQTDNNLWHDYGGTPTFTAAAYVSSNEVLLAAKATRVSDENQGPVSLLYRVLLREDGKLRVDCSAGRDPFPVDCDVALICVSPSKKRVAVLFTNGDIHAGNRSLRTFRLVGKTDTTLIPQQMSWIGNRIISYAFLKAQYGESWVGGSSLFLLQCPILEESDDDEDAEEFGVDVRKRRTKTGSVSGQPSPSKEINNLPDSLIVTKEVDGIKILSSEQTQIFQIVPTVIRKAFDFDKMDDPSCCEHAFPSAKLIKAFNDYVTQDPACIDSIGHLVEGADLEDAVNDVIEAAGFEIDVAAQKQMLRVASFGRSFSSSFDSQPFVNMTCHLRVLYNLRESGMFLSLQQFYAIKMNIVERLTYQGLYSMAFKTAELLNLPKAPIVIDWAGKLSRKLAIDPSATPVDIAQRIVEKCKACGTRGPTLLREITSASVNNVALAMALISEDPCYSNRVGLKIQLGKLNDALQDANDSGDPELIGQVMLSMLDKHSLRCFDQLSKEEGSRGLLRYYIVALRNRHDGHHLEDNYSVHYADKNPDHAMMITLKDYFTMMEGNGAPNQEGLGCGILSDSLIDAVREEGDARKRLHEHCTLLSKQEVISRIAGLRNSNNNPFLNSSVATTISLCFRHGLKDEANTIAKQFRIPEKMFCWAKLQGLVAAENWSEVDTMGAGGKSPIGFEPFVQQLVKVQRLQHAAKYISKCVGIERRMELYMLCDDFKGACADCVKHGEMEMLVQLRDRAKTQDAINEVGRAIKACDGKKGSNKGGFSLF